MPRREAHRYHGLIVASGPSGRGVISISASAASTGATPANTAPDTIALERMNVLLLIMTGHLTKNGWKGGNRYRIGLGNASCQRAQRTCSA